MSAEATELLAALRASTMCLKTAVEEMGVDPAESIAIVTLGIDGSRRVGTTTIAATIATNDAIISRGEPPAAWAW